MRSARRDPGMTLIELIVSVAVVGLIAVVIAAAITVVFRQAPETAVRVDVARWEQNLGTWLPADLTSAEWPDSPDPVDAVGYAGYEPCASDACTFGDNIAHLTWNDGGTVHVSYRYGITADGTYEFRRVACRGASCTSVTLVRDMPPPAAGGEAPITVTFPPDVLETDPNGSEIVNSSGRRVTVGVNGSAGIDLLTFSGGSIELVDLQPAAIEPPAFLQARSGCGGPITLIVDTSGSLNNSDVVNVKAGVRSFVEAFAGTPTQLQIVAFSSRARVLDEDPGDPSPEPWNHWFDLSEQSVVDLLLGGSSPINTLNNSGATNWEDALYRAFYTEGGQTYEAVSNPATPPAELVVFFTDGLPTNDRDTDSQTGAETPEAPDPIPSRFDHDNTGTPTQFSPRGWYRAHWLRQQTSTRLIGVGVGNLIDDTIDLDRDTQIPTSLLSAWSSPSFLAEVPLGDLIAGNDLSNFSGTTSERYLKVEYDGGWDAEAVKDADILTTTDFTKFGGALETIALAECGGSLTVQTRVRSTGAALPALVKYEVSGVDHPLTESSTSAVSKTAVFDISTDNGSSAEVLLRPATLAGTGYAADDWTCRTRNVEITDPGKVSEADPTAGAIAGLNVTVAANEAVSCILFVVPE